jgi:hypothetical protein
MDCRELSHPRAVDGGQQIMTDTFTKLDGGSTPAGCRPTTGSPYRQSIFTELMLNASVEKADESRLSKQGRTVLALFREAYRKGQTVNTAQLVAISAQYQGRLFEVRRWLVPQCFCIDLVKRGKGGLNFYAVVPLAKSTFFAKHRAQFEAEGIVPVGT